MTAKIKLKAASGGGSFSLQAPSSSANNRVMTLPDSADGTVLTTTNPKAGNIIQVKQAVKTDTTASNSQTFADVLTVSITPASNSSKFVLIYKTAMSTNNGGYSGAVRLVRDSTAIYVGDAAGNRVQASSHFVADSDAIGHVKVTDLAGSFMDEPSTASAITYRLQYRSDYAGTYVYLNQSVEDGNYTYRGRVPTSLIVMEVAG